MAHIMTKMGQLDNVITYEHFCDTISDRDSIDPEYINLGSVAIVLEGESGGIEFYMAKSSKEWKLLNGSIEEGEE